MCQLWLDMGSNGEYKMTIHLQPNTPAWYAWMLNHYYN